MALNSNYDELSQNREQVIIRTSIIGILANVLLAAFKAGAGLLSNSIAIVLDAVNNLSDALSSVITIIGTHLAGKEPDKEHPFGYGRVEYMSQLIVAAIVLYAGITSLTESVKKILHPEAADYSTVTLVILAAGIVVKLLLGTYVKKKGREVNSGSLVASGSDASFDAILSASVLASAVIYLFFHISLEAFVGVAISVIIIKSGVEMIKEAVDEMLGQRAAPEVTRKLRKLVGKEQEVLGVYDLILNNYGPDRYQASLHVEVRDTMTAAEIDDLTRRLQQTCYKETGIPIVAVGIYSRNTGDTQAAKMYSEISRRVLSHEGVLQMHGFHVDEEKKSLSFDVILDFGVKDRMTLYQEICEEVGKAWPDYTVQVILDNDYSD